MVILLNLKGNNYPVYNKNIYKYNRGELLKITTINHAVYYEKKSKNKNQCL